MELSRVILSRRSIRQYKKDHIPDEVLKRLFEAINAAPSGNNHQPYKFIVIKQEEVRQKVVSQACHQEFLFDAPVLVAACCEKDRSFDTAIAMENLVLAATNEGLGSCYIGWFEKDIARKILNVPDHYEIPILVAIGYADENPEAKERKSLDELISFDQF
jgi:nitroreductase